MAAECIWLARCRPWAHYIGAGNQLCSASEVFTACKVPPSFKNFLMTMGPVIRDGQLTLNLPIGSAGGYISHALGNKTSDTTQNWTPFYNMMDVSAISTNTTWGYSNVVPAGAITWNTVTYPGANIPTYGLTPHYQQARYFAQKWTEVMDACSYQVPQASQIAEYHPALVPQDCNVVLGRAGNLIAFDLGTTKASSTAINTGTITAYDVFVTGCSAIGLVSKTEYENALVTVMRVGITPQLDRQTAPYSINTEQIFPVPTMLNADVGAVLQEAFSFRVADTGGFVSVAGVPLDATPSNPITEAMQPLYAAAIQGILPPSVELGKILVKDLPAYADNQFAQLFPNIEPGSMLARNLAEVFARAERNPRKKMSFGKALREGVGAITRTTGEVLGAVVGQGIRGIALGLGAGGGAMVGKV